MGIEDQAKAKAGEVWSETKDKARSKLNERKDAAADQVGELAGALHGAAERAGGENKVTGQLASRTADMLDGVSGALRRKDLDTMLREAESFARHQPALFLGAAVAAGFIAIRFLKASQERGAPDDGETTMPGAAAGTPPATPGSDIYSPNPYQS